MLGDDMLCAEVATADAPTGSMFNHHLNKPCFTGPISCTKPITIDHPRSNPKTQNPKTQSPERLPRDHGATDNHAGAG